MAAADDQLLGRGQLGAQRGRHGVRQPVFRSLGPCVERSPSRAPPQVARFRRGAEVVHEFPTLSKRDGHVAPLLLDVRMLWPFLEIDEIEPVRHATRGVVRARSEGHPLARRVEDEAFAHAVAVAVRGRACVVSPVLVDGFWTP